MRRFPESDNVVLLHPRLPALSARDRARMEMLDLLLGLDEASREVVIGQLLRTHARLRRHTPVGRLVRGEAGPVAWRAGAGPRWLVAPESRRFLRRRANG